MSGCRRRPAARRRQQLPDDAACLTPLKDRHINFRSRYPFNFVASGPGQGLRPLGDPDAVGRDDAPPEGHTQGRRGRVRPG
ncbi:hypothetical protein T261_8277 [Streptomyces lydicus]|nr:hypothetical protein T261_8277 [Streptomyces lydicus]